MNYFFQTDILHTYRIQNARLRLLLNHEGGAWGAPLYVGAAGLQWWTVEKRAPTNMEYAIDWGYGD